MSVQVETPSSCPHNQIWPISVFYRPPSWPQWLDKVGHLTQLQNFYCNQRGENWSSLCPAGCEGHVRQTWSHLSQHLVVAGSHMQKCNLRVKLPESKTKTDQVCPWNFKMHQSKNDLFFALSHFLVSVSKPGSQMKACTIYFFVCSSPSARSQTPEGWKPHSTVIL